MSQFAEAIVVVLRHEGGWVEDPADPGGATNYGISLAWAREALGPDWTRERIRTLTENEAIGIYRKHWWEPHPFADIVHQDLATKCFDMAVNMGPGQAAKLVQRACNDCGSHLDVDGKLGVHTIAAINSLPSGQLLDKLVLRHSDFYRNLARSKPALAKFLNGWLVRAAWPLNARRIA